MVTGFDRRKAPRFALSLPVRTPGPGPGSVLGVTKDIGSGGLYFHTELEQWNAGDRIDFTFDFPAPISDPPVKTLCRGTVMRSERAESLHGIAVRIDRFSILDA